MSHPEPSPDLALAIGRRLFEEQVRLKLDSKALAAATRYSAPHITALRTAGTTMRATFLARIAPLGFDVLYILTGKRGAQE